MGHSSLSSDLAVPPYWSALFATHPYPCFLLRDDLHILSANSEALHLLGVEHPSDLSNRHWLSVSPEQQPSSQLSQTLAESLLLRVKAEQTIRLNWILSPLNRPLVSLDLQFSYDAPAELIHCIGLGPATLLQRSMVKDSVAQLLPSALDGLGVAVFIVDTKGVIQYWNQACSTLTRYSAEDMLGTSLQWMPFYPKPRPVLADIVAQNLKEADFLSEDHYGKQVMHSPLIPLAREGCGAFPLLGGKFLYFTASPLFDPSGLLCGAIETIVDLSEFKSREQQLIAAEQQQRRVALTDKLTGLGNRRALDLDAQTAESDSQTVSVALLDLDDFKQINDTRGHLMGDEVLARIGSLLSGTARQSDSCFRYGGEEFVVLMHQTSPREARQLMQRVLERLSSEIFGIHSPLGSFKMSASVGLSCKRAHESLDVALSRADQALYTAKRNGKAQIRIARKTQSAQS